MTLTPDSGSEPATSEEADSTAPTTGSAPRPPLPSQFARMARPPARAVPDPELDAAAPKPADVDRLVPDENDPANRDDAAAAGVTAGVVTAGETAADSAPTGSAPPAAAEGETPPGQGGGREAADLASPDPATAEAEPATAEAEPATASPDPATAEAEPATTEPDPAADSGPADAGTADPAAATDAGEDAGSAAGEVTDPWGRVAEDGTVFVRTADGERAVGSWQVGEPAQALDYYRRKYDALVVEVELLERRIRSGALSADEGNTAMRRTRENVDTAQAVGDLASLISRLDRLQALIEARRAKRKAERAKAVEAARVTKEKLVTEAEALGESSDWHEGADRLRAMLDEWKALARLDRAADDELWHRFSAARTTYTRRRKVHFAEQADKRDDARTVKERLVAEAEEISTSTEWGPTAARYRALMTEWKAAGPAPRKEEDVLWRRFRGAQDVFFAARSSTLSERDTAEKEALQVKEQLLVEAEALLPVTDLAAAKSALRSIQDRWSAAGRVPRDAMTRVEARLRTVEETIRSGEQAEWTRTSPEALARAEATVAQLRTSVEKLEKQASSAEQAGDTRKATDARAAIATRQSWLAEAEKTLADFRR